MVPFRIMVFWNKTPTCLRTLSSEAPAKFTPSQRMTPRVGSRKRVRSPMSVLLPDPLDPQMATYVPLRTDKFRSSRVLR
jgi:hypothetical protein